MHPATYGKLAGVREQYEASPLRFAPTPSLRVEATNPPRLGAWLDALSGVEAWPQHATGAARLG
jgi:hypothetical protein